MSLPTLAPDAIEFETYLILSAGGTLLTFIIWFLCAAYALFKNLVDRKGFFIWIILGLFAFNIYEHGGEFISRISSM